MKTIRIVLKVPFYKHPAGTVFELADTAEPANWPEEERAREKLNFNTSLAYQLPDGGRGFAVSLPVSNTSPCPDHVFEGRDLRRGECRVTLVNTRNTDKSRPEEVSPPCGTLRENDVQVKENPALSSRVLHLQLPPFAEIAEKMVLLDNLRGEQVLEYLLRNYKSTDTELTWDVSELRPGFYDLQVCFPGGWYHLIRLIKFFPFPVVAGKIPG